jgi:thiol-disulfide isomerase/thioredoxin
MMNILRQLHILPALIAVAAAVGCSAQPAAPPDRASIVAATRAALADGGVTAGATLLAAHERAHGVSPQSLLAESWLGRTALAGSRLTEAEQHARGTYTRINTLLTTRGLDDEPDLPIALGATIEVLGQSLAARGQRSEAVTYLEKELTTWGASSMVKRIQKNLHLISLDGEPGPALSVTEWLGDDRSSLDALDGHVVVLFFWAHWCSDCKRQGPILEQALARHGANGLRVFAPTQRFGYAQAGEDATPAAERAYIEQIRALHYSWMPASSIPIDEANHIAYGVSTTPTVVIMDRNGRIRKYHPGVMSEQALEDVIGPLLAEPSVPSGTGL